MQLLLGDSLTLLKTLPDQSVQTCVTSPPYWRLRDYGIDGQLGLEATPEEYTRRMVEVFREVRRVLRDDGTLWLNLGDSYAGSNYGRNDDCTGDGLGLNPKERYRGQAPGLPANVRPKNLIGIPWRIAFALQADGWYLRQDIIWHKPNPLPESVKDRCAKAHEYIFLFSKSRRYYFDNEAISEPIAESTRRRAQSRYEGRKTKSDVYGMGAASIIREHRNVRAGKCMRNKRSVWTVTTQSYKGAHFATYPPDLIRSCILAGAPTQHTVLDPFMGSGTTGYVALSLRRNFIGIELNPEYVALAKERIGVLGIVHRERAA